MNTLTDIVKARRSAMKFQPDVKITAQELEEIFSLVRYTPSAFNLQHARYIVIQDEALKNGAIYEAANKQYKVKTAAAAILVLGDKDAYKEVGAIHEGLLNLGAISKQEYDETVNSITRFYEDRGEAFQHDEAIRNASLSAMQFMLIAKEKGWDTCPMIGFDAERMREALHIPERQVPVMLITLGKEDTSNIRTRGYRKPVGEFVRFQ